MRIPAGGLRAALTGGNTIGAAVREKEPRTDGYRHLDTPALIAYLTDLGANAYLYGIWDSPTDWDDLRREFAPAAAEAGIDVWPYLVPPSETRQDGRASRPYMTDFVAWAQAIAELSVKVPSVTAWAIDDFQFAENAKLFTDSYMTEIVAAQREINPELGFYTCAYYDAATSDEFLDQYGPYIDGIIYPFLDGHRQNTHVSSTATQCLDAILAKTEPRGISLLQLVYAGRFLDAPIPLTEQYVTESVATGLKYAADGRIAGVIAYGLQWDNAPTPSSDRNAMYGDGRLSLVVPAVRVGAGNYGQASTVVRVQADAPRHELSFWHHRAFTCRFPSRGDYAMEVLIDNETVWESDVLDHPWLLWIQGEGLQGPVDVTRWLRGKTTATLTFRLRAYADTEPANLNVGIDHLESLGFSIDNPDFTGPDGWTTTATGTIPPPAVEVFAPDRPARILAAVREQFR
ncbi:hypothetical protein GCM10009765_45160 [Fodinicola feengrottensis]|uniref:Uncharacterized protein n=1 Tax=Fodinicola feengrottensis TaxID=435914 RepID=A0ABN2HN74_9ACTN